MTTAHSDEALSVLLSDDYRFETMATSKGVDIRWYWPSDYYTPRLVAGMDSSGLIVVGTWANTHWIELGRITVSEIVGWSQP